MHDSRLALFLMVGQSAQRSLDELPETVPGTTLEISEKFDLASVLPAEVRSAEHAGEVFKLFFVFENFLRDFVLETLTDADPATWWDKVPPDVRDEVEKLERTEEQKQWMALDSRSKLALTTLPQLVRIMDETSNWKALFDPVIRDKSLLQEARHISHIRNTICHMSDVSDEEVDRVKQVMRDWFRVVSP